MKKILCVLSVFLFSLYSFAQDSCQLRITLLTCAPGTELYSTFGHTAIRVQNLASGSDDIYNYGTFEFDDDFYAKFVRGKLKYELALQDINEFIYQYRLESRSVIEQEMNLSCNQRNELLGSLRNNLLPQNRSYRYDFLFDNCTTRARDIVDTGALASIHYKSILQPDPLTFREHIYVYLNRAHQDWSKLGIDLLLGAKLDRKASNIEAMFLPDNLMLAFDSAVAGGKPLVKQKTTFLEMPEIKNESLLITPAIAFSLFLAVVALFSFIKKRWAQSIATIIDFLLFFILGLIGALLVFMWFGTDHALCANNYNLLWALPTNLAGAFFVHKKLSWVKRYFQIVFGVTLLLLIFWAFLPQQMNNAFLPLVFAILLRSFILSQNENNGSKKISVRRETNQLPK